MSNAYCYISFNSFIKKCPMVIPPPNPVPEIPEKVGIENSGPIENLVFCFEHQYCL